jgi:uncharacterized protein YggE
MNRNKMLMLAVGAVMLAGGYLLGTRQGQAVGQGTVVAGPAGAAGKEKEKRLLTTSGTATIRVKPDSARVFFRVETYAPQVKEARADNGRINQKIIQAVKALNINNLKMKTDNVNVTIVTNQNRVGMGELPKILGYHVISSFTVLVENDDARKLGEQAARVLDTALENGATGVDRVAFFKKDTIELRRQILTKAVEDAMSNARALARGADEKLKESLTIADTPQYYFRGNNDFTQNTILTPQVGGEVTPLVAGDLELNCHVSVTCRY